MELFHNIDSDPGPDGEPNRSDAEIKDNIKELYHSNEYLKEHDLKVTVQNCKVDLEGKVFSQQSWELAQDLAADVRGVEEVHNHIQVVPGPGNPAGSAK